MFFLCINDIFFEYSRKIFSGKLPIRFEQTIGEGFAARSSSACVTFAPLTESNFTELAGAASSYDICSSHSNKPGHNHLL